MSHLNNSTKEYSNNRIGTGILIGILICVFLLGFKILLDHVMYPSSATSIAKPATDELAVEVNAVNNILTWGSFIVAVLTIVAAVFGITGFIQLRNNLQNRLDQYYPVFKEAEALVKSADELKKSLAAQQSYIDSCNDSLIRTVYSITNQIQDKDIARKIIQKQLHAAQIINLYRPCINPENKASVRTKKLAALLYLQQNIEDEDLTHLEFVIDNDSDSDIIKQALELALYLKMKNNPDLYPSKYKSSSGK